MNLKLIALAAAGALATVAPLQAQIAPELPGTMDASRILAGTYTVDPSHTLVGWRVNHFGFNDYFGLFGDVNGTLMIDPDNPETAKLDVIIPVSSVLVASSALRDHLLRPGADGKDPDFFGVDPEPARFVSTDVVRTGPTTADITGNLTLNGVTKPVTIAARFTGAGVNPMSQMATVGFAGAAEINRTDFGIDFAVPMVSDRVVLDITAAFEKH